MMKEFRAFLLRGNVVELAVGVVIGGAFGAIVKSLVDDVIMPPIGMLMGRVDFKQLKLVLQQAGPAGGDGKPSPAEVAINYGAFINALLMFAIVGFCVFMLVKAYNRMFVKSSGEEVNNTPADIELLTEIRDLLKSK